MVSINCSKYKGLSPEYIVNFRPPERIDRWWFPPVYRDVIDLIEVQTGRLIAQATDVVLGGGFVSLYMRVYKGDQDFLYLSCGYASPGIGPYRPSMAGRPRVAQYESADFNFIAETLGVP